MRTVLTKTKLKEGKRSEIPEGRNIEGKLEVARSSDRILPNSGILDIKIGDIVLVFGSIFNFIKTSEIVAIQEQSDEIIKFETETSFYELKIVDNESEID